MYGIKQIEYNIAYIMLQIKSVFGYTPRIIPNDYLRATNSNSKQNKRH